MKLLYPLLLACCAASAQTQSSCSSDGQPVPVELVERFISADCESCWSEPDALQRAEKPGQLALDWIVPGQRGEEAPLAAAASRDALERLHELNASAPAASSVHRSGALPDGKARLRVAQGLALADYMGASIEFTPVSGGPWSAVLALVEQIPAGVDGTPIARNLVRNTLVLAWREAEGPSAASTARFFELRPMGFPQGAQANRLRVVAWVQHQNGSIVALARSDCGSGARD